MGFELVLKVKVNDDPKTYIICSGMCPDLIYRRGCQGSFHFLQYLRYMGNTDLIQEVGKYGYSTQDIRKF